MYFFADSRRRVQDDLSGHFFDFSAVLILSLGKVNSRSSVVESECLISPVIEATN